MKYFIWPLGCQMNKSDAERIETVLKKLNYKKTDDDKVADLIIVVACSVRQSAVDRVYGKFRWWAKRQKKGELTTVLTGCVLEKDLQKFKPKFDLIFDINDLNKLPHLLHQGSVTAGTGPRSYLKIKPEYNSKFQAFVPIMTGCNNFCTYCAVPYTRGREKSRPSRDIISECKKLIKNNYKEITLLGENVNSYGKDKKTEIDFPTLLEKITKIEGDFWLRFTAPHPKDFTIKLIKTIKKHHKICKQINLPLQSGNDVILKKMNRPYTTKQYLQLVDKIKKYIPNISLSTDAIVGFPSETKAQFNDTAKLFKKVNFNMAFVAQFSPRPGTPAAAMKDNVEKIEKKRRDIELTKTLMQSAKKINNKLVGQEIKVLVEKYRKSHWLGRTEQMVTVRFLAPKNRRIKGKFVSIKITKADAFHLYGNMVLHK